MSKSYDVVVIGAGTGGYVAAIRAAQLGKTVAVVEKQSALGGTCLIWGCIPTKALLEHAHALKVIQQASEWGVTIPAGTPAINMTQVHARKDKIVGGLTKGIEFLFKKNKITWVKGTARLAGPGQGRRSSRANGRRWRRKRSSLPPARRLAVSRPSPSITRASSRATRQFTSRRCPKSLVILGSGAVGVEFASIYRRFGSEVTIIELLPRLVPVEDEAVSAELEKSFKKQGITVLTGTKVTQATSSASGVSIEAETPDGKKKKIAADMLLVATGRGPVTTGLGAEEAGIAMERGYIKVDELYRTSVPRSVCHRRRHHARHRCPSAAGARLVDGRRHHRRTHCREARAAAQLRPRARLHLLRSRDRQRRPHRGAGQGARIRRDRRGVPVWRAGSSQDGRRIRGIREDRGRQEGR